ncbi:MAG: hypothetical protein V3S17_04645 [candidate division Zixibacteria bacterium]
MGTRLARAAHEKKVDSSLPLGFATKALLGTMVGTKALERQTILIAGRIN